jgi:hypothetical protein
MHDVLKNTQAYFGSLRRKKSFIQFVPVQSSSGLEGHPETLAFHPLSWCQSLSLKNKLECFALKKSLGLQLG